jgi:hypothetical protein
MTRIPDGLVTGLLLSEHYQRDSSKLANPCYVAPIGYEQTVNLDKPGALHKSPREPR